MKRGKHNPTIGMTFKERRDYYVQKSIEKFGKGKFNYDKVKEIEIKKSSCIITCSIHGDMDTSFGKHLDSTTGCYECGRTKCRTSKRVDFDDYALQIKNINPEFKLISRKLKPGAIKNQRVFVQSSYGIMSVNAGEMLLKSDKTIKNAVNKTQFFINKYRERHGWNNLLDFSKFEFIPEAIFKNAQNKYKEIQSIIKNLIG